MNKIPYQTSLVTGASSGIGKAFAYELAKRGMDLVITARSEDKLIALQSELQSRYGIKVWAVTSDLSRPGSAGEITTFLNQHAIDIDLLINNAGMGYWTNFLDVAADAYVSNIQLNISSLVALSHSLLPSMVKSGRGGIINIASGAALQPGPFMAVYAASKAFVLSFSEALYGEFNDKGVRITAVLPGNTPTEFQAVAKADTSGMPVTTVEQVVEESLSALLKGKSHKIVGGINYLQSFAPRLLPRRTMIGIMKNLIGKRVNKP